MSSQPVLDVQKLKTYFYLDQELVAKAVDDVTFSVYPGKLWQLSANREVGKV